ncbi:MAG: type II toxin-antitoxin system YhaV family toxin [Gemmatimonadota bacterium]|nr:type II toxin-antitoxin system YhaV family toxin [Gemmatimonadota bacterium]
MPLEQVNGWTLLAHPLFLDQLDALTRRSGLERPSGEAQGPSTKLLAHVLDLIFVKIPQDPTNPVYRHGGTLAGGNRDWFRAKTGNGRFRLFFRFSSKSSIIVYAWLNDESTLRTYDSPTDAYKVFAQMLAGGNPPRDWTALHAEASDKTAVSRLSRAAARVRGSRTRRST